jgi:hypothetical protein
MNPRNHAAEASDAPGHGGGDGGGGGGAEGGNLLAELRGAGGGGDAPPNDGAGGAPARRTRRLHTQTLVLALVLSASVASLYTMRKQGMGAGINFAPIKNIDYKSEQLRPEELRAQQRVMAELARSVSPDAFHDEPLRKNPFKMDTPAPVVAAPSGQPQGNPEADARARRAQSLQDAFAQLSLAGVMQGPVPLARINGKTVRVSDTIDGTFMVVEIHERSVDLMADEQLFTLQMSDTSAPGGGGRAPGVPNGPGRR